MKTKLTNIFSKTIEKNINQATGKHFHAVKILGEGARTLAVLVSDDDGNLSVYKCDKKLSSLWSNVNDRIKKWKKEEKYQAISNLSQISKNLVATMETHNLFIQKLQNKVRESSCHVNVPNSIYFNNFTLEEYAGETTTYQLLSGPKADDLSLELAKFYAVLHKTSSDRHCKISMFERNCSHIPQILERYKNCLPKKILVQIQKTYDRLSSLDTSDEIEVPTHGDFRRANLCYNPDNNRLSVIDWELANFDNIYSEFLCRPLCSQQIPYSFISKVVDNYNKFSQHKINKNKLKDLYFLTLVDETGRNALNNECSPNDFVDYYEDNLLLCLKMIDGEFSTDSSNESDI